MTTPSVATSIREVNRCYHCGDDCGSKPVRSDDKSFCCDGCKMVFELLSDNQLCTYYDLESKPGLSRKSISGSGKFECLEDPAVASRLLTFENDTEAHIVLHLPQIHCSSCVWLLEHLYRLDPGIRLSRTDFMRKEMRIEYIKAETNLRKITELLTFVGYEPQLNFGDLETKKDNRPKRMRMYRIAVAAFCFANIMLLSFPEYFHLGSSPDASLTRLFGYLNLGLSLPVFFFSGGEFFVSAWQGLRSKYLNIDVPLALSILITFGRSVYEITTETGAGYLDSMAGIIFFMLLGRHFQEKTYTTLRFDREYKSYFPLSVSVKKDHTEKSVPISELKPGDRVIIHNQELVPSDSRLIQGEAWIDYSFVTGESRAVHVKTGDIIYAGGRQTGTAIELDVIRAVEQSHLTHLWNREAFRENERTEKTPFIDRLAAHFTVFLLLLSFGAWVFWFPSNPARAMNALTTVLIVACPCALLLSATFTHGSVLRWLSRNGLYLRNAAVIDKLGRVNHIVFDKTGTITEGENVSYHPGEDSKDLTILQLIRSVTAQSNHPRSRAITRLLESEPHHPVSEFLEIPGKGLTAVVGGHTVRAGSAEFVWGKTVSDERAGRVYVRIDEKDAGYFHFETSYRKGLEGLLKRVRKKFRVSMLSGDNEAEREKLSTMIQPESLHFHQTPEQKMDHISSLQKEGGKVLMAGDGLNDAGALRQADVGIAVSDDINNFYPACDAIMKGESFDRMDQFLRFAKQSRNIIFMSFGISLLYNVIGLSYAVSGALEPVIAAILMPVSSVTIVLFTTGMTALSGIRNGLR